MIFLEFFFLDHITFQLILGISFCFQHRENYPLSSIQIYFLLRFSFSSALFENLRTFGAKNVKQQKYILSYCLCPILFYFDLF